MSPQTSRGAAAEGEGGRDAGGGFEAPNVNTGAPLPAGSFRSPPVVLNLSCVPTGTGDGRRGGDTTLCRAELGP